MPKPETNTTIETIKEIGQRYYNEATTGHEKTIVHSLVDHILDIVKAQPQTPSNALQELVDVAMRKFLEVKNIIHDTLDSQPDTADPVQHNKWLTQAMQEIEKIIQ